MTAPIRTLLVARRERLVAPRGSTLAALLARGTVESVLPNALAGYARAVPLAAQPWPLAALTREFDCADAGRRTWVRADPASVRADGAAGHLLASGALALDADQCREAEALLAPLFAAEGIAFSAPHPERWYVGVDDADALPDFVAPPDALGRDLREVLPSGADARRWVARLNAAQIELHNAPFNAERAARGLAPVNSVWFWGAGRLPEPVPKRDDLRIASDDPALLALARLGHGRLVDYAVAAPVGPDHSLVDLRAIDDASALDRDWLDADLAALKRGRLSTLALVFADGERLTLTPRDAWRLWRR